MKKHFETERLILKTLDYGDAWLIVDFYARNMDFLREWETDRTEEYYTLEYQKELLHKEQIIMDHGASLRLWIFKKNEPEKTVGCIAFDNIVMGPFKSCYMGYKMDKDELNKGFITEAARKGIEVMFKEYGLHRIEANIMPRNIRSLRVTEKLGFHNEGLAFKYLKINGKWEDHIHMVLLNEDLEKWEE
jgi:ribosomal-protein-alanine N-acetyltransferase